MRFHPTKPDAVRRVRLAAQPQRNGELVMKRLLLVLLSLLWAQAAVAASPIVDGQYVAEAIARNALVWDVRPPDAYARGHIAGALSIGDAARVLRDENTEDFIPTDRIEKILGAAGLDPSAKPSSMAAAARGIPISVFTPCSISAAATSASTMKASRIGPLPGGRSARTLGSFRRSRSN